MNEFIKSLLFFIIFFIIIYVIYYNFFLKRKYALITGKKTNKKKKTIELMELSYLIGKFKLDPKKIDIIYCLRWIAILDAFIISFTATIIFLIPWEIMWQLLVGFVMVFGLIYALYEIFGRHLVKKGWSK